MGTGLVSEHMCLGSGSASNLLTDLCQVASSFRAASVPSVKWEGWASWFPRPLVLGFCALSEHCISFPWLL